MAIRDASTANCSPADREDTLTQRLKADARRQVEERPPVHHDPQRPWPVQFREAMAPRPRPRAAAK